MPYLQQLQDIADRNGGNRAHGTSGYLESAKFVKQVLDNAGFQTRLQEFTKDGTGYNVIADWPGGDESHTVMLGAHLDSVPAGPGIADNGSGSAAILATAVAVSRAKLQPTRHLRFAWWDYEEGGLHGSTEYVTSLTAQQLGQISGYLNFDMTGFLSMRSWSLLDPSDDSDLAKPLRASLQAQGKRTADVGDGNPGTDTGPFVEHGVPVSGFTTGMTDCIHKACDRIDTVDPETETVSTNAIISAVWSLAGPQ